jgi:membrane-bound metal-dependent hydrolase YbcI (DUF457 family)
MTSPEHTLVGIHFAFATGIHRCVGWRGVTMAGIASNIPDWDGIPMLFDMQRFESGHRVWGHCLLSIILTSVLIGFMQIRWDWIGRGANRLQSVLPQAEMVVAQQEKQETDGFMGGLVFALIGMCAQLLHLPCDMVVSGGSGLSDWAVQPLWPFLNSAYVYPLIPWGDIGPTVILMAGIIAIAKRKNHISQIACLTIGTLSGYLVVCGLIRGTLSL